MNIAQGIVGTRYRYFSWITPSWKYRETTDYAACLEFRQVLKYCPLLVSKGLTFSPRLLLLVMVTVLDNIPYTVYRTAVYTRYRNSGKLSRFLYTLIRNDDPSDFNLHQLK